MSKDQALETTDGISVQPTESLAPWARIVRLILLTLFYIYLFVAIILVPYFNWCYARDHGFVSWIFFGEIVATLQSGIWPYYALSGSSKPCWSDRERDNLEHFHRSSDAIKQATRIINAGSHDRPSMMKPEESQALVALHKIALNEAQKVDLTVLAKAHPDLPAHFRDKYLRYLELINRCYEGKGQFDDQIVAQKKFGEWVDWFNSNTTDIHMPKRAGSTDKRE